jgi:cytochrome c oxidase accessory protein FixG
LSASTPSHKKPNLDSVTTINEDGSHFTLHPADVTGRFTLARRVVALVILAVYVALPWININGHPAVFLDVAERRFHLFGLTFLARDLWLAFFFISGLGFSLFFITSLFGRLWCGWTCPYTLFLEHIYRRIERWIDGDAAARRKLDRAPWDSAKITRRVIKHGLYLLVSAIVAHVFLSYFVSLPKLYQYMQESPLKHFGAFAVVLFITVALYFAFSWFREQFCIILCPYGRIQSALTDDDTTVIGYDEARGEPRGKKGTAGAGDCINCNRCVQVCPTGIDIRNGLQMECIGCAACVDACDAIMAKIDRPKGLVRYDSLNGLKGQRRRILRPRIIVYSIMLALGASMLGFALTRVHDVDMVATRMGMMYTVHEGSVRNQFQLRLLTKRNVPTTFTVELKDAPPWLKTSGCEEPITVAAQGEEQVTFVMFAPKDGYTGPIDVTIRTRSEPGGTVIERQMEFLGPDPRLFKEFDAETAKQDENRTETSQ